MKTILLLTALLWIAIVSPSPVLEHWQASYRAKIRAGLRDYLPENPRSREERALLREICAFPDSPPETAR